MPSTILLVLAAVAAGLTAGVFFLYANAIVPGLRRVDDRTFVAAFQAIDRAIINPLFLGGCFVGTLVLTVAAAVTHLGAAQRGALAWIVAAGALHVAVMAITVAVHVPRNDALKAAGDPDAIEAGSVRRTFDERRWARWNLVRVVLAIATAVSLSAALAA